MGQQARTLVALPAQQALAGGQVHDLVGPGVGAQQLPPPQRALERQHGRRRLAGGSPAVDLQQQRLQVGRRQRWFPPRQLDVPVHRAGPSSNVVL